MDGHRGDDPQPPDGRALLVFLPRDPGADLRWTIVPDHAVPGGRDPLRDAGRLDQPRPHAARDAIDGRSQRDTGELGRAIKDGVRASDEYGARPRGHSDG